MLSARAYSFRMKSRLAISLGWIAGYVNVVSLLACGTMTSHVTGNMTIALLRNVEGQRELAGYAAFTVAAFLAGAVLSAVLTEHARRAGWRSKYVVPILVEAVLLLFVAAKLRRTGVSHVDHDQEWWSLVGLAGMAMGLQNATITRISGSIIRTTHLTGVVTDLGIESVQFWNWWRDRRRTSSNLRGGRLLRLARRQPSLLRLLLLVSITASFVLGAGAGAWLFHLDPSLCLVAPVAFLGWIVWVDWRSPIADVRELDEFDDPVLPGGGSLRELLPPEVAAFRLHASRRDGHHRAPDFAYWAERLPPEKRILLLAFSPTTRIDENSALSLRDGVEAIRASGRHLVLGGVTPVQYMALERYGVLRTIGHDDVHPDLEFAAARALTLVHDLDLA